MVVDDEDDLTAPHSSAGSSSDYRTVIIENIVRTSRTAQTGRVDTRVSIDKPKSTDPGVNEIHQSLILTLQFIDERIGATQCLSSGTLEETLFGIAVRVQNAGRQESSVTPRLRRHEVPYGERVSPGEIPSRLAGFVDRLAMRVQDATEQAIDQAAWIEYQIDRALHPFEDGCGRIGKLFASFVLLVRKAALPRYPERDVYYSALEGRIQEETDPVRRPAAVKYLLEHPRLRLVLEPLTSEIDVFTACYRYWTTLHRCGDRA